MAWLVTGGAGYVGAHVVRALQRVGLEVVVLDDLSTGRRNAVPTGVPFVHASIADAAAVGVVLSSYSIAGVIHLTGARFEGSVDRPSLAPYGESALAFGRLLQVLVERGVDRVVYGSSAAVYGSDITGTATEDTPCHPDSPYGRSTLIGEWLLDDVARQAPLRYTSLRIVNVIGSAVPGVVDLNLNHVLPRTFDDLRAGRTPRIHGDDYPTPDGTPVRDLVSVRGVALAIAAAARRLDAGDPLEPAYNLGTGQGVSVRKLMESVARVTGIPFEPEIVPRRAADPARLVATSVLAQRDLGWEPHLDLDEAVASAWLAYRASTAVATTRRPG